MVLEAAAAGLPIIATNVGGVPEVFGPQTDQLIPPDDLGALIAAIEATLDNPVQARHVADAVRARVRSEFAVSTMVDGGLSAYREAIALQKLAQFA